MSSAESFARSGFARFINSTPGRLLRVVVGLAVIAWGYTHSSVVLMVLGFIPLVAGVMNLCFVSALLGGPISGKRVCEIASKRPSP